MALPAGFLVSTLITDMFSIENLLVDLECADLFKAYDAARGRSVGVWIYRDQFKNDDERLVAFVKRMSKLSNVSIRTPNLFSVGLDPSGLLFVVVEYMDGYPITQGNLDVREAERRFVSALHITETLHAHGIALGDLGDKSFWLNRHGDIALMGIMGDPMYPGTLEDMLRADVAGLIAICRRVFGASLPQAPKWIHEALKIGEATDGSAPVSATMFAAQFRKIKERSLQEEAQLTAQGERRLERRSGDNQLEIFEGSKASEDTAAPADTGMSDATRKKLLIGSGVFFLFCVITSLALLFLNAPPAPPPDHTQQLLLAAANDRMKQAAEVLRSQDALITDKRAKFEELSQSDDPVSHTLLVDAATKATDPTERLLAERAILDRAKRLKLDLIADAVKTWLDSMSLVDTPPEYELSLKLLDGSLPAIARGELAERIFTLQPILGSKFLSALVLSSQEDIYRLSVSAVVAKLGGAATLPPSEISSKALIGLLLENSPELQAQFAAVVKSCSDSELRWLSLSALQQNKIIPSAVLDSVIERKLYGDTTKLYFQPLQGDDPLPDGSLALIGRLLSQRVTLGDVEELGIWLHPYAIDILKALLIDMKDTTLLDEALDYLSGRSSGNLYVEKLSAALRQEPVPSVFAVLAGVSTALDVDFSRKTLERAVEPLSTLEPKHPLFSILINAPNQSFVTYYLEKFHDQIPGAAMVALLSNPLADVRIAAIRGLKNVNSTPVLQIILQAYEAEHDPQVRSAYEEELWVVRERVQR